MKNLLFICLVLLAFSSCKKDDINDKSNKLIGTWEVAEIKPRNLDMQQLKEVVFNYGIYEFRRDNSFTYTRPGNTIINGTWTINRRQENPCNNCASTYTYSLTLNSEVIGHDFQGWFSNLKISNNEFLMSLYLEGINNWFDYKFRKK